MIYRKGRVVGGWKGKKRNRGRKKWKIKRNKA